MDKSLLSFSEIIDTIKAFFTKYATGHIILTIILILITLALFFIIGHIYRKIAAVQKEKATEDDDKKTNLATLRIIFDSIRAILIIVSLLTILQVNGVQVTSLITGLGIAGAVLGLAIQDPLKDLIMGIQITSDKFYKIGDAVRYNGFEGTIISMTLRTTKIIDFDNSQILSVSNRNISEIVLIPDPIIQNINVPLSYENDPEKIHSDMLEIAKEVEKDELIKKCVYRYTNSFESSSITYTLRIFSKPTDKLIAYRRAMTIIQRELNKRHYVIPYDQLDIHTKN